jgi:hypothetical protein
MSQWAVVFEIKRVNLSGMGGCDQDCEVVTIARAYNDSRAGFSFVEHHALILSLAGCWLLSMANTMNEIAPPAADKPLKRVTEEDSFVPIWVGNSVFHILCGPSQPKKQKTYKQTSK